MVKIKTCLKILGLALVVAMLAKLPMMVRVAKNIFKPPQRKIIIRQDAHHIGRRV